MTTTQSARAPRVHNGTYTIASPAGKHVTIKLHTVLRGKLEGRRILSLLVGPNNESDFAAVAFWNDDLQLASAWNRYKLTHPSSLVLDGYHYSSRGTSKTEQTLAIWVDLAVRGAEEDRHGFWFGEGYRLHVAGHCVMCNRKLTTPESIESGIGPKCAERIG